MNHQDDDELLKRLQKGDETAFQDIFEKYKSLMLLEANFVLKDPTTAKDVVQEVVREWWTYKTLHKLEIKPGNNKVYLKTYIKTSVKNKCWQVYKRVVRETAIREGYIRERSAQDSLDYTEDEERRLSSYQSVLKSMKKLPPQVKAVMEMIFLQEMSRDEVSKALNIKRKTVSNHLIRGFAELRKRYDKRGQLIEQ